MNGKNQKKFLTTKEAAELLNVNEKMIYSLINEKGLPATKVTGKWLFPRRTVEQWLETHMINNHVTEEAGIANENTLLIAGSDDPLFQETISLYHAQHTDVTIFFANLGSIGGLNSLRRNQCHMGVCHLLQDDEQEYNFEFVAREFRHMPVLVNFSQRQQGIIIHKNNPKGISKISDLARPDIRIVNRPMSTGTRLLLDHEIAKSKISCSEIKGYDNELSRHIDVGLEILAGRADAGPAISAVATLLNLDFIPLRWERFDLLIYKNNFFNRSIQNFLGMLNDQDFQRLAQSFTGYDLSMCGKIVYPNKVN